MPNAVRAFANRLRLATAVMTNSYPKAGISSSAELAAYLYAGRKSVAGATVSPESAMAISTVRACVRVLAEGVAMLPLNVYRELPAGGKERAKDLRLDRLLHRAPNRWQTAYEWREMMTGHVAMRGNAFSLKVTAGDELTDLLPLHPDRMKYGLAPSGMVYEYTNPEGRVVPYLQKHIFHVRGLSSDGIGGRSVIDDMRESLGIAMQQETFEALSYARGGLKNIVLSHPQLLDAGAAKRIADSWAERHGGADGMWKPVVLEEGMKVDEITLSAADMQFIEARKLRKADIASGFRVPPHMVGDLDRSTNNNIETQSLEFLIYTLMPWLVRWEQRIQMDLIGIDNDELFAKHNANGLLRGDVAKRGAYYQQALINGWMNKDEVRALEDMNPIPGGAGQKFSEPANLKPAGSEAAPTPVGPGGQQP